MKNLILLSIVFVMISVTAVSAQTSDSQVVKTISGGVLNGKAANLAKPEYPAAAQAVGAGGAVNVQVTIDEVGNVVSAKAVSGHPLLRQAAENAAYASKFTPTTLSGQPVKVVGVIVYGFNGLSDSAKPSVNTSTIAPNSDGAMVVGSAAGNKSAISGGVVNGKAKNLAVPAYPAAAKAVKASGAVNVQVLIDEEGTVISANAVSGHPLLRAAAVQAAIESKFSPTKLEGQPVKVTGIIVYNFTPGNSSMEKSDWLRVGYDLQRIQFTPSLVYINTDSLGRALQSDWTTEIEQLRRLTEIKQSQPQMMRMEKRADGTASGKMTLDKPASEYSTPDAEQVAISQTLIAAVQSRLAGNQLNLWKFNTGAILSQAFSKLKYTDQKQNILDQLRQQIQTAPGEVSPIHLAGLQRISEVLSKSNPTADEIQEINLILPDLLNNQ